MFAVLPSRAGQTSKVSTKVERTLTPTPHLIFTLKLTTTAFNAGGGKFSEMALKPKEEKKKENLFVGGPVWVRASSMVEARIGVRVRFRFRITITHCVSFTVNV